MNLYKILLFLSFLMLKNVQALETQKIPPLFQNLQASGVKLKFLATSHGLQVWEARKEGDVRLLYLTPDQEALILGNLYNKDGALFSPLPEPQKESPESPKDQSQEFLQDLEATKWIALGNASAPVLYVISEPFCDYCLTLMEGLLPFIEQGKVQVRIILVSFLGEKSRNKATFILGHQNPAQAFLAHIKNPRSPVNKGSSDPGLLESLERNKAFMVRWNITTTPFSVFKDKQGHLKVMEGSPESMEKIIQMF